MKCIGLKLAMIVGVCLAAGCQSTELSTTWKDPTIGSIEFQKVAVLVLNSTPAERRAQEDELVRQIKRAQAVPSYTFVPDEVLHDRQRVKQLIRQSGSDGLVVLRLIAQDRQTQYIPGSVSYWGDGFGYYPSSYTPGQYVTNTYIRAEVSLYSVKYEKLIWAGASTTVNPAGAKDLARQISSAAAEELRRQKLLQ